jgi:hypothetical protein
MQQPTLELVTIHQILGDDYILKTSEVTKCFLA